MAAVERVIILAAGKSLQLDGVSKVLIRHPVDGRTILDHALDAFHGKHITVVVGYRAIQIMQAYPALHYVYNAEWALTNNAMSLALALTDAPTYVISGDIFLNRALVERLDEAGSDVVLTSNREKRGLSAIHCVLDESERVLETYQGPIRNIAHPESVGLFKVSTPRILRDWKRRCVQHSNLFMGQLIPCDEEVKSVELRDSEFYFEINTPTDYQELVRSVMTP